MPNWCMNDVLISGPKEKVNNLYNEIMDAGGLLCVMSPSNKEIKFTISSCLDFGGTLHLRL